MSDPIDPSHYHMAIEPREFIIANKIGFCEGNVIKYVCRWERKDGVQDLRKARNYIDRLIKKAEEEATDGRTKETTVPVSEQTRQHENRMCAICCGDPSMPAIGGLR